MSAFFVTDKTVADAVRCMSEYGVEREGLARDLWRLNVTALQHRYGYPAEQFEDAIVAYGAPAPSTDPFQILKSANCLLYQCSEGDVPEMPLFKELLEAADALSARLGHPEGGFQKDGDPRYEAAKWDREDDVPGAEMRP